MKDLLEYILKSIADHPDDIVVDETGEQSRITYTVHANPEDMGKIIGKQGRIIRAIRDLVKLTATKKNTYVDVVLAEQ